MRRNPDGAPPVVPIADRPALRALGAFDRFLSYGVNIGHFDRGRWYRLPDRTARELRRLAAAPPVPRALRPTSFFDLFIHAVLWAFRPALAPLPLTRAVVRRSR
jgi:hypothetical protein